MEVRFNIDDAFLKTLQDQVGSPAKATDLSREALTMFNWAIQEASAGRVILSTSATGGDVHRLIMPTLTQVENKAKAKAKAEAR